MFKTCPYFLLVLAFVSQIALANTTLKYEGDAKKDGELLYIEYHTATYDNDGEILKTTIEYKSTTGKLLATMESDFKDSLTLPVYTMKDARSGNVQGVRRKGEDIILFNHNRDKAETTRVLTDDNDSDDRIFMSGQGLNYYLLKNLNTMKPETMIYLRFLVPSKLDYYDFNLELLKEKDNMVDIEVTIKNVILKLFAPKIEVRYDKIKKELVWYRGPSNLVTENGKMQNVTITYKYNAPKN